MRYLTEEDTDSYTLIEAEEFIGACISEDYGDHDGYAYMIFDEEKIEDKKSIAPSDVEDMKIPENVTHFLWIAE